MSAEKIGPQHRARKAVLYFRQSSAHQVQHNRESQALQYAIRERLVGLGFAEVEVIDEDLGCSAAGGTPRAGFQRMVVEVFRAYCARPPPFTLVTARRGSPHDAGAGGHAPS